MIHRLTWFESHATRWSAAWICLLLAAAQFFLFFGAQYLLTERFSLPLDDSFIHMQYAKQLAQGEYFRYQPGEPVSGGATSFLYPHLLAVGWLAGFREQWMVLWALWIAWLSSAAIYWLLIEIGDRLGSRRSGWYAMALTWLSGPLAWAFWGGMEIALFSAILLWSLYEALNESPRIRRLFPALGLLAMCRPEGSIIAAVIVGILALRWLVLSPRWIMPRFTWPDRFSSLFLFCAFLAHPLFNRLTLGSWGGNTLKSKSLLHNPILSAVEAAEQAISNAWSIILYLCGIQAPSPIPGEFVLPGLLPLAFIGFLFAAWGRGWNGYLRAALAALPLLIVFTAVATLEVWSLHNYRYLAPYVPILMLFACIGAFAAIRALHLRESEAGGAVFALAALLLASNLPVWVSRYAHESAVIYEKQTRTAQWASTNVTAQRPMAINDAGILAYYGAAPVYDLVGLITNDTTIAYRLGEGGLYEMLQRIPDDERPHFAAVFPSWFEEMASVYEIFYRPRVYFPDPFDPGFGKMIYEINWFYSGKEINPRDATLQPDWVVKDSLDVADLISEQSHNYVLELRDGRFPRVPNPFRRNFGYNEEVKERWPDVENEVEELIPLLWRDGSIYDYDIVDAGRRIERAESFTLRNLTPHQDVFLILRTCDSEGVRVGFAYRMAVEVDGVYQGEWIVQGTPWNWYETVFTIPGAAVASDQIRIRISNIGTPGFPYYESYYYWACQKDDSSMKESLF